VAEALGCGLPVLISDKVNIWREVIAHGAGLVRSGFASGNHPVACGIRCADSAPSGCHGEQCRALLPKRFHGVRQWPTACSM